MSGIDDCFIGTECDGFSLPRSVVVGSVTQSALEDAFLDMAGSRLDASR